MPDITKMPKAPKIDLSQTADLKPKYRPEPFTLRRLLTSDESKPFYIGFLKEMANKKGPWREYFEFYAANQSGDVETMKPEIRKYCEKLVKDVQEKYTETMG
jgi:hypothetical protein